MVGWHHQRDGHEFEQALGVGDGQGGLMGNSLFGQSCFSSIMYGCESWTVKKAEHQRIDVFALWCWRRLFESLGL